jgi:hypothetical protein
MRKSVGFVKEPRGDLYAAILRAGLAIGVPVLGLGYPRSVSGSTCASDLSKRLSRSLINRERAANGRVPSSPMGRSEL